MSSIKNLAKANCSNYFDGGCLMKGSPCNADQERCHYLEESVIPGINRKDNPDYQQHKTGIRLYQDTVQTRKT